jgi:uncharacterized protein YlxW (UPF0749 family)
MQELHAREAEITSSLQNEQTKLNDLQERIDALEKSLETHAA